MVGRDLHRRAQLVGIAARAASKLSASMPGVLDKTPLEYQKGKLVLHLPESLAALDGEALRRRLRALAQFLSCETEIRIGGPRLPADAASIAAKRNEIVPK
jgi:hypothetical protein